MMNDSKNKLLIHNEDVNAWEVGRDWIIQSDIQPDTASLKRQSHLAYHLNGALVFLPLQPYTCN